MGRRRGIRRFPVHKMNTLIVVGARPNFMKAAPIIAAIHQHNQRTASMSVDRHPWSRELIQHLLVHTGQHYDDFMSRAFFRDLNIPTPDVHLEVGSGSHAAQTAEVMKKFEPILLKEKSDVVVLVGDVNSTLACALVTAKISFVGNTMIDSLLALKDKADASTILDELGLRRQTEKNGADKLMTRYALLTLHRPGNVDNRHVFQSILAGLEELRTECSVVFPVHPRTRERIREFGFESRLKPAAQKGNGNARDSGNYRDGIILIDPLGYLDFLCLMKHAALVVTDSGGIQEETTILGTPCVTVRENTERPITVESGTNTIAGTKTDAIKDAIRRQLGRKSENDVPKNWDGRAGARIIDILVRWHYAKTPSRQSFKPLAVPLEDRYLSPQPN